MNPFQAVLIALPCLFASPESQHLVFINGNPRNILMQKNNVMFFSDIKKKIPQNNSEGLPEGHFGD